MKGRKQTDETKAKISEKIKSKIKNGEKIGAIKSGSRIEEDRYFKCEQCNKEFNYKRKRKFCSLKCLNDYKKRNSSERQIYRSNCEFNFSLNDYPDEFDFSLIEQFGWYKAKNHGNNLNGVSRDHKFSVNEGFKQNVDPEIIRHPANCQLLRHNDNVSKFDKCSITLEELKIEIEYWNRKYNMG